jgi:hypothetical protein
MRLPDPPTPAMQHGLKKDDCALFANIILTWGAAEDHIGSALLWTYQITDGEVADDLVNVLDGKKKRDLLKAALTRRDPNHPALPILKKIATAWSDWVDDRNALAHGFGVFGPSGVSIRSSKPKPPVPVERFQELLNKANWLYLACSEVWNIVTGHPSDEPLPDRPA